MKKIIFISLLVAGVCQLKAQQIAPVKPADSLLNNLNKNLTIKPLPFQSLKPLDKLNFNSILANTTKSNTDRMPVAMLKGSSKMPVKKLGGYYTMPVKPIGSEEVPGNMNGFPLLPTLKTP